MSIYHVVVVLETRPRKHIGPIFRRPRIETVSFVAAPHLQPVKLRALVNE